MLAWFVLWALYSSIVNVGGSFYSFGWETLLLEAGFLAIFLGNAAIAPPLLVLFLFRWLAFRVEFGAGLIKLRGDRCWRDLTCMDFHHETQPMPNPLSWFFHKLPRRLHRVETIGNFVAQLVLPFGLFLPQPFATVAAVLMLADAAVPRRERELRLAQLGHHHRHDRRDRRSRPAGGPAESRDRAGGRRSRPRPRGSRWPSARSRCSSSC